MNVEKIEDIITIICFGLFFLFFFLFPYPSIEHIPMDDIGDAYLIEPNYNVNNLLIMFSPLIFLISLCVIGIVYEKLKKPCS